jgi:uncharacterized protein YaeQ
MALKATVHRCELQVVDMDRHHYAEYTLSLAQHPSETDARLMVRLLAFGLFAEEGLQFGKGVSSEDEPDLWQRDLTGAIEHWIELGQPDEARLRRACGRARRVTVIGYQPRSFAPWWEKNAEGLARLRNLEVLELPSGCAEQLGAHLARGMAWQCQVQEGEVLLINDAVQISATPIRRQSSGGG